MPINETTIVSVFAAFLIVSLIAGFIALARTSPDDPRRHRQG